jgi:OFA family oxalate/formate antiporter-like MFS transporter
MTPAGRIQDLKGPRPLLLASAALIFVGYGLSSLTQHLWWIIITYGFIMGAAIAAGYMAAVAGGLKWFPDLKGTATGILVGGFGAAAAVFAPMARHLIAVYTWRSAFVILGAVFAITILITALIIKNPPPGWVPAGWDPAQARGPRKRSPEFTGLEFSLSEMLRTSEFKLMWVHYILVLCGGFGIIVHLKPLAMEFAGFSAAAATGLVALIGMSNLAGRFILSPLSDAIGRLKSFTIVASCMLLAVLSASLAIVAELPGLLYFTAIVGGTAFGGYLALSPAFTADMWGMKSAGTNYGAMFTGWGVASFVGPYFAGSLYDLTGTYVLAFLVFGLLCIPAIFIARVLVKPANLKAYAHRQR